MDVERISFGGRYEEEVGYSRVVKAGGFVLVAGTTAAGEDGIVAGQTPYEQAVETLRRVGVALERAGVSLADVVLTRMYVTDMSRSREVTRAHAEVFGDVRPVSTLVGVQALADPRMLVEIEVMAVAPAP
jgi:enamine deaminase RidA (YjgF/YER057c/UK114 family)